MKREVVVALVALVVGASGTWFVLGTEEPAAVGRRTGEGQVDDGTPRRPSGPDEPDGHGGGLLDSESEASHSAANEGAGATGPGTPPEARPSDVAATGGPPPKEKRRWGGGNLASLPTLTADGLSQLRLVDMQPVGGAFGVRQDRDDRRSPGAAPDLNSQGLPKPVKHFLLGQGPDPGQVRFLGRSEPALVEACGEVGWVIRVRYTLKPGEDPRDEVFMCRNGRIAWRGPTPAGGE